MNVILIAGGPWQAFLLRYLKTRGYCVHVVNPVRSDTTAAADGFIQEDVRDIEKIQPLIEKLHPLFVTSDQSDTAIFSVALLSQKLGLPGNPPDAIRRFVDKGCMYDYAASIGLPLPPYAIGTGLEDVRAFAGKVGLPIIVKPVDATGTRGFAIIDDIDAAEPALRTSLAYTRSGRFITQKYVRANVEITLEGFCSGSEHRTLTGSSKTHFSPGIASSLLYPFSREEMLDQIISWNDTFVNNSGMKFGLTHAEYMIDTKSGTFWLTEIAARGAGCAISSEIVPWVSGVDVYDLLCRSLTGDSIDLNSLCVRNDRCAIAQFYDRTTMAGITKGKIEMIRAVDGVHDFFLDFRRHDYLPSEPGNRNSRHSLAIVRTKTLQELEEALRNIKSILSR